MNRLFLVGSLAFIWMFGAIDSSARADDDIGWEVVHPFRFFKYDSDFEIHRLAHEDLNSRVPAVTPTILEMDRLLNRPGWWDHELKPEIIARYEDPSLNTPRKILAALRKVEIDKPQRRPAGAPELASQHSGDIAREYDFRRMGWASLLFPFHQSEREIGKGELIDAANVGVCWNRSGQRHNNCPDYIKPPFHTVSLRLTKRDLPNDTECKWSIDEGSGAKFVGPPEGVTISAPCNRAVRLRVPFEREAVINLSASGATYRQTVKVRDVLAVSLGDSFSSGEGNPDVPAKMRWTSSTDKDPVTIPDADEFAVPGFIPLRKRDGDYFAAQWIDRACHRSAYSYPVRAAIQMALNDKHRSVTFLGYACSGAEVNEGLFAPFMGPEYASNKDDMPPYRQAQIPLMLSELCEQYANAGVREEPISGGEEDSLIKSGLYKFGKPRGATAAFDPAYRCSGAAPGFKRPIDVMMLSIGGNDAGFSKWIKASITSYNGGSASAFLPILKGDAECAANAGSCREMTGRWRRLEARYALLREFLSERVSFRKPEQQPVLVYTYPGSATDKNGYCASGNSGMTVLDLPSVCLVVKEKGITKLPFIEAFVNTRLNPRIAAFARPAGASKPWLVVNDDDDYISGFRERSFCATDVNQAGAQPEPQNKCYSRHEILALHKNGKIPVFDAHNENETLHVPRTLGTWQPFNPVLDFSPYHPRRRWMRTINDVYVLINQQSAATRNTDVVTLLGFSQSAVYGAFHPTAEAHARVADAFTKGAETMLKTP